MLIQFRAIIFFSGIKKFEGKLLRILLYINQTTGFLVICLLLKNLTIGNVKSLRFYENWCFLVYTLRTVFYTWFSIRMCMTGALLLCSKCKILFTHSCPKVLCFFLFCLLPFHSLWDNFRNPPYSEYLLPRSTSHFFA